MDKKYDSPIGRSYLIVLFCDMLFKYVVVVAFLSIATILSMSWFIDSLKDRTVAWLVSGIPWLVYGIPGVILFRRNLRKMEKELDEGGKRKAD